jgi:hypothetical protein
MSTLKPQKSLKVNPTSKNHTPKNVQKSKKLNTSSKLNNNLVSLSDKSKSVVDHDLNTTSPTMKSKGKEKNVLKFQKSVKFRTAVVGYTPCLKADGYDLVGKKKSLKKSIKTGVKKFKKVNLFGNEKIQNIQQNIQQNIFDPINFKNSLKTPSHHSQTKSIYFNTITNKYKRFGIPQYLWTSITTTVLSQIFPKSLKIPLFSQKHPKTSQKHPKNKPHTNQALKNISILKKLILPSPLRTFSTYARAPASTNPSHPPHGSRPHYSRAAPTSSPPQDHSPTNTTATTATTSTTQSPASPKQAAGSGSSQGVNNMNSNGVKQKKVISGRPLYSKIQESYLKNVLNRKLGELYQIDEPVFKTSGVDRDENNDDFFGQRNQKEGDQINFDQFLPLPAPKCTQISSASHSDVAIYTFGNDSNTKGVNYKFIEYLQPHLHYHTLDLKIPQSHYRKKIKKMGEKSARDGKIIEINTFDTKSLGFHRFILLQTILEHLFSTYFSHLHTQTNPLSTPTITIPLSPDEPISIRYDSSNVKDLNNVISSLFLTLKTFAHKNSPNLSPHPDNLFYWFQTEIFNLVPKSLFTKQKQRLKRLHYQIHGLDEEYNVRTQTGEIIDMNEGMEDPELVNNVINELGYNPRNLSRDELDHVYKTVEERLESRDVELKDVFSDDDIDDDGGGDDSQDGEGISSDEEFSRHHKEELAQLEAITKKNVEKRKNMGNKSNLGDNDNDNDNELIAVRGDSESFRSRHVRKSYDDEVLLGNELTPQDPRLYHGILPQAAIEEIERVDALDEEYEKDLANGDKKKNNKNEQNEKNQKNEKEWVISGKFHQILKQKVLSNPNDKITRLQFHMLSTLTIDDVLDHFSRQFAPLLDDNCIDPNTPAPENQDNEQTLEELYHVKPSITLAGPDLSFQTIVGDMSKKLHHLSAITKTQKRAQSLSEGKDTSELHPFDPITYPIVNINLPHGVALPNVHTKIKFHTNLITTDENLSKSDQEMAQKFTKLDILTNFDIPRRFGLAHIDLNQLEQFHGFSTISEAQKDDQNGLNNDSFIDITTNQDEQNTHIINGHVSKSKYHGLPLQNWVTAQFQRKTKTAFSNIRSDMMHLDPEVQWNVALLNTTTNGVIGEDGNVEGVEKLSKSYQSLPRQQRRRVDRVLEFAALHIIHDIVSNYLDKDGDLSDRSTLEIITPKDTISTLPKAPKIVNLYEPLSLELITRQNKPGKSVITTVDDDLMQLMQRLVNIADSDQLNLFSFNTLVQHSLTFQEKLSNTIQSLDGIDNDGKFSNKNDLEDLVLAKTFLPMLIFGTADLNPHSVHYITALSASLHFETLFKYYFVSNPYRSMTLTSPDSQNNILQLKTGDRQMLEDDLDDRMTIMLDSDGENDGPMKVNQVEQQYAIFSNMKKFTSRIAQREVFKKNNNKLNSNDIIFDFDKNNDTTNPTNTALLSRHFKTDTHSNKLTLRHLLGGQVYLPIPGEYNSNPDVLGENGQNLAKRGPNGKIIIPTGYINNKKEYETKWLATHRSKDHNVNKNNSNSASLGVNLTTQQVFNTFHEEGYVDCIITSDIDHSSVILNTIATPVKSPDSSTGSINSDSIGKGEKLKISALLPEQNDSHEHTVNMTYTKQQQTNPSPSQLYIPLTKQLARPVFITVDDSSSNMVELEVEINQIEERLTPQQLLLLPIIKFLFGKQTNKDNNGFGSDQAGGSFENELKKAGIDISIDFHYAKHSTNPSKQQINAIIHASSHVNMVNDLVEVLINTLTRVDLTQNIVELLTDFSSSLTTIRQNDGNNETFSNPSHLLAQGKESATTQTKEAKVDQNTQQQLYHNGSEMSLYSAMQRLPNQAEWDPKDGRNDAVEYHGAFLSTTKGTIHQQYIANTISSLFTELDLKGADSAVVMGENYQNKFQNLPTFWKNVFLSQDPQFDLKAQTNQISPLLVLLINDVAETLKCLLLGPAEEQFVHMPLSIQEQVHRNSQKIQQNGFTSSPINSDIKVTNNKCNNNYFTPNDRCIPFDTQIKNPSKHNVPHEVFSPLPPNASLPLPTEVLPSKKHKSDSSPSNLLKHTFDPTYPNIYAPSKIISKPLTGIDTSSETEEIPNAPPFGLSSVKVKTNKHTLSHPTLSTLLTSSVSKLINQTYMSQITAYVPEAALVGCYLHQDGVSKSVPAKQMVSSTITQENNQLNQGQNGNISTVYQKLQHDRDQINPTLKLKEKIEPQNLNTSKVVPLLSVRNLYSLNPHNPPQPSNDPNKPAPRDLIRVSQHGLVGFIDEIELHSVAQYNQHMLDEGGDEDNPAVQISTHVPAVNFLQSQALINDTKNNKKIINKDGNDGDQRGSVGNVVVERSHQYIVAPVSSTTTTIAFGTERYAKYTKLNNAGDNSSQHSPSHNDMNASRTGLLLLGQYMLQHLLDTGSANTFGKLQGDQNNNSSNLCDDFITYITHFNQNSPHNPGELFQQDSENKKVLSLTTIFNPIDGIFAIQQVKDHTVPISTFSQYNNSALVKGAKNVKKINQVKQQFNDCYNFVEGLRVFTEQIIRQNIDNNEPFNSNAPQTSIPNCLTFDHDTFEALKVQLLTAIKKSDQGLTQTSTQIIPNFQYQVTSITPSTTPSEIIPQLGPVSPAMVMAIRSATPAQICQVLKQNVNFFKSKINVVGPLEDVPEQLEADAKTTNGVWSLHVL